MHFPAKICGIQPTLRSTARSVGLRAQLAGFKRSRVGRRCRKRRRETRLIDQTYGFLAASVSAWIAVVVTQRSQPSEPPPLVHEESCRGDVGSAQAIAIVARMVAMVATTYLEVLCTRVSKKGFRLEVTRAIAPSKRVIAPIFCDFVACERSRARAHKCGCPRVHAMISLATNA
jgi:hypothetical protein